MENYRVMKDGIKQESTGYRPQNYSNWHRQLAKHCYAYDVDFVEYRVNRGIVGLFEIKQFKTLDDLKNDKAFVISNSRIQIQIYRMLTCNTIYGAYLVLHTYDMEYFEVWNVSKSEKPNFKIYDKEGYSQWIENL